MKRWIVGILILLLIYLSSGFFTVQGNEKAIVRRFGKLRVTSAGNVELIGSGLHYELPAPFSRVDRVNLNEVRTLSIGLVEDEGIEEGGFLQSVDESTPSQFLTGDKNILNLQVSVQYRISKLNTADYLFGSESPEDRLRLVVESNVSDLVSRSGVDFVHPLGLGRLRELLTTQVRQLAETHRLGIDVEEVTVGSVYPPSRVKADFIEVSNARADREKYIYSANAYAVQLLEEARAQSQRIGDEAEIYQRQLVESSKGAAFSFGEIVKQFQETAPHNKSEQTAARRLAMERMYLDSMEQILRRVKAKVILDSGKPVDLTIFRDSQP